MIFQTYLIYEEIKRFSLINIQVFSVDALERLILIIIH